MQFQILTRFLGACILLSKLAFSSHLNLYPRDTAELYIFANCVNNHTYAGYAAIFWYYPDFLPDFPEPQLIGYVNNHTTVHYAGHFTDVTYPFTLKATIPKNATKATYETLVSTDVTASSFAGPMAAFKGSGKVFYTPEKHVNCVEEYYQQDHQTEDDF